MQSRACKLLIKNVLLSLRLTTMHAQPMPYSPFILTRAGFNSQFLCPCGEKLQPYY